MEATAENLKDFGAMTTTKVTHYIDSSDLNRYLGGLFGHGLLFEILEAANDSNETVSITDDFETKYTTQEELDDVEKQMKTGTIECYRMGHVFSWLYHYKHIPEGNYIIGFAW